MLKIYTFQKFADRVKELEQNEYIIDNDEKNKIKKYKLSRKSIMWEEFVY